MGGRWDYTEYLFAAILIWMVRQIEPELVKKLAMSNHFPEALTVNQRLIFTSKSMYGMNQTEAIIL